MPKMPSPSILSPPNSMEPTDPLAIDREPKAGFHGVFCFMCGIEFSTVTHRGGENRLDWCEWCKTIPHYCMECSDLAADEESEAPNPVADEERQEGKKRSHSVNITNKTALDILQELQRFEFGGKESIRVLFDTGRNEIFFEQDIR